ncbi:MAG: MSCRAMM family protein [Solirubrobacterales bacterium]
MGVVAALLVAACALVALLLSPGTALAANGSISGTVTSLSTGFGIEGVEVCAWGIEQTADAGCEITDEDGEYKIPGLTPGEYAVEFWPGPLDYAGQWFDSRSFSEEPDPVVVVSGLTTTEIDAELERNGEIEGRVVSDAPGHPPLEGIEVFAGGAAGYGFAVTDEDGEYTIDRLAPGTYKVGFWAIEGGYVTQYFDGEPSWEAADPFAVTATTTTPGIDAEMERSAPISGLLSDASTGARLGEIEVCAQAAVSGEYVDCTYSGPSGGYELSRVPSGTFKIVFSPEFFEEGEAFGFDGYLTQYYNDKPSFATANPISVTAPNLTSNINARLVSSKKATATVTMSTPPLVVPALSTAVHKAPHCKKGFRKLKVKGKKRCVRLRKKKHRKRADGRHGQALRIAARLR